MNFYDLPKKVDRSLYDDAMRDYAQRVQARTHAVYSTGNITFPGLSDLDLVVVPTCRKADNAQFLSAMDRLPPRYAPILLHDPMVMPLAHKSVLRYTTHRKLKFVAGEDVLSGITFVDTPEERWCKLLEGYCTYATFVASMKSTAASRGRRLIAKASSLRFSLRETDELCGTNDAPRYEQAIDSIRSNYFSLEPFETLNRVWRIFEDAYGIWTAALREVLPVADGESVQDFARRLFAGEAEFNKISSDYVCKRSAEIDAYHQELFRLRIPFGQMFFWEAHGGRARIYRQTRAHNVIYRAKYKLQRMLATSS